MDDAPSLALRLLQASTWFDDALRQRLAGARGVVLTASQSRVFAALEPGGSSVAGLARRVGVTRQSMHRTVGELVATGLLEVAADPDDGRASAVRLTPAGEALVRRAVVELRAVERELGRRIGADAVRGLREALALDWGAPPT